MNDLLGLDADLTTALTVIVVGVLVPALTAILKHPGLGKTARRLIPIGLSAVGAVVIVIFQAGGPLAEKATTWVLLLATLVGIAQALYAVMPKAWTSLEAATSPKPLPSAAEPGQDGAITPSPVSAPTEEFPSPQSGLERSESAEPYSQRTLNQPEGEDYTRG